MWTPIVALVLIKPQNEEFTICLGWRIEAIQVVAEVEPNKQLAAIKWWLE